MGEATGDCLYADTHNTRVIIAIEVFNLLKLVAGISAFTVAKGEGTTIATGKQAVEIGPSYSVN